MNFMINDDGAAETTAASTPQTWTLTAFHPFAGNAPETVKVIVGAVDRAEAALREGTAQALTNAMVDLLGDAGALTCVSSALGDTLSPTDFLEYEVAVSDVVYRYRDVLTRVECAVSDCVARGEELVGNELWSSFQAYVARMNAHRLNPQAERLLMLGAATGFDALADLHVRARRKANLGQVTVEGASIAVTHVNASVLLKDKDRAVRKSVAALLATYAEESAPEAEVVKRARTRFVVESKRLQGYPSMLAAFLDEIQLSPAVLDTLQAYDRRIQAMGSTYFEWLRGVQGYDTIHEFDVGVCHPFLSDVRTPLPALKQRLMGIVSKWHPDYPAILDEAFTRNAILHDPRSVLSPAWYALPPTTPQAVALVHSPYYETAESVAAMAHELGHACHLTAANRARGPLGVSRYVACYAEIFSLLFEIAAVDGAARDAKTGAEKAFWANALVDQFLHFARDLNFAGRFDLLYYADPDKSVDAHAQSYLEARAALTPTLLRRSEESLPRAWLQNLHQEQMPFYGLEFATAFLIAYHVYLHPQEKAQFRAFAEDGRYVPLAESCRARLGLDIERPGAYDAVFRHMEVTLKELVSTRP